MKAQGLFSDRGFRGGKWAILLAASVAMILLSGCTHSPSATSGDTQHWTQSDTDCPTYSLAAGDALGRSVFANGSGTSQAGFANLDCFWNSTVAALDHNDK